MLQQLTQIFEFVLRRKKRRAEIEIGSLTICFGIVSIADKNINEIYHKMKKRIFQYCLKFKLKIGQLNNIAPQAMGAKITNTVKGKID